MVSLRRRQVIIAGLATAAAPAAFCAAPWDVAAHTTSTEEKLVLSGRILGSDGRPLAGATVAAGRDWAATDADGRFALLTTTRRANPPLYRVTCDGHAAEGFVSDQRRDTDGTWRASFGLTLV
jgi:hypothetical protein